MRGLTGALETGLSGVRRGQITLDGTAPPFSQIAQTIETVLNTGSGTFSWRELVSEKPLTDSDRRSFIEIKPILDFNALEPGKEVETARWVDRVAAEAVFCPPIGQHAHD